MTAISTISETERRLLKILGQSLKLSDNNVEMPDLSAEEWEQVYLLADRHEVSVLLRDVLNPDSPPKKQNYFQLKTARAVRYLLSTEYIFHLLFGSGKITLRW